MALSLVDSLYYPFVGSTNLYTYGAGYGVGTRLLFTMATGTALWSAGFSSTVTDSRGNVYSVINRSNNAGSVAILHCKLTVAVSAGDTLQIFPFSSGEAWVQVWTSDNDTGVTAVSAGAAGGGTFVDGITPPVSFSQSSGVLANGGLVLGLMLFVRAGGALTLIHTGSGDVANHDWVAAGFTGHNSEAVWVDTVPSGVNTTFTQTGASGGGQIYGWIAVQVILPTAAPPAVRSVRHTRTNTGRLVLADGTSGGQIFSRRYSDALPPVLVQALSLDTGTTDQASITTRPCQWLDVVYSHNGPIKLKTSKDRGRTYGAAVTVAASGYRNPTHAYDKQRQRFVVVMQSTTTSNWFVTIAGLDSTGAIGTWSTPVQIALGTGNNAAGVTADPDGGFTLTHVNSSSQVAIIRCKSLSNTGAGTWS